jgi:hypothetical protein
MGDQSSSLSDWSPEPPLKSPNSVLQSSAGSSHALSVQNSNPPVAASLFRSCLLFSLLLTPLLLLWQCSTGSQPASTFAAQLHASGAHGAELGNLTEGALEVGSPASSCLLDRLEGAWSQAFALPSPSPTPNQSSSASATPSATPSLSLLVSPYPQTLPPPLPPLLLSPWRYFADVWSLPLLPAGVSTRTQALNHERNFDFAAMLYAEADRLYFVDAPGPVCFTQSFFVSAGSQERAALLDSSEMLVEVDGGAPQLLGSVAALYKGEYAADLEAPGAADAFWRPAAHLGLAEGWGATASPAFPRPLTYTVERSGSVRSGFILHAPVCAHSHLRMSWRFPAHPQGAPELLQDGSDCVAGNRECTLSTYVNPHLLSFAGLSLPPALRPFNASQPAFSLPEDEPALPGLQGDVLRLWSPFRLYLEALESADGARSVYGCGVLGGGGAREFLVFDSSSSGSGSGSGVGSLLTFDFPSAPHLLHSARVQLVAEWDGGRGELRMDLESLFGPGGFTERKENFFLGEMPRKEGQPRATAHPTWSTSVAAVASGGLYLALPMPWHTAARVRLVWLGSGAEVAAPQPPSLQAMPAAWPPVGWGAGQSGGSSNSSSSEEQGGSFDVCASFLVDRRSVESVGSSWGDLSAGVQGGSGSSPAAGQRLGYLQGASRDGFSAAVASMDPAVGAFVNISGAAGSLVALSVYLHTTSGFVVEGDVRVWGDGSASPMVWSSGLEDFFGGGHGYAYVPHHAEAFTAWDRHWDDSLHIFQRRLFALDAPRFQHSLQVSYESLALGTQAWRSGYLFYGAPAPPPVLTDTLRPVELLLAGEAGEAGRYTVHVLPAEQAAAALPTAAALAACCSPLTLNASAGSLASASHSAVEVYTLSSLVPGMGDVAETAAMGGGAGGGVLLTEAALAIHGSALVSLRLRLDPGARAVQLRRLVDVRRSVAVGEVWVDGVHVAHTRSADISFATLNAFWQWESLQLPAAATAGKGSVVVQLRVGVEEAGGAGRVYLRHQLPPAWTEAVWEVHCFPALL